MKPLGDFLVVISIIAVILSIVGALGFDLWLASTQWILVAAVLAIWAVYVKIRD